MRININDDGYESGFGGCATVIAIMIFNLTLGAWSVHEILSWFGKYIPTFYDVVLGMIFGQFTFWVAIAGKILRALGVF